jgi:signal transduction histidine kinase
LTAALRGYQQLQRMVETQRGLEIIIEAAPTLFDFKSMQRLAEAMLTQIASLLNVDCAGIVVLHDHNQDDNFTVLAGTGSYRHLAGENSVLDAELQEIVRKAFIRRCNEFHQGRSELYLSTASGREIVVLIEPAKHLSETDRALIEVFCSRLSVAFDNVILYEQLQAASAHLEQRVTQRTQELKAANQRLAAQWVRLQQSNRLKGEILSTVAHDLKNPLGVISGRTEILSELVSSEPIVNERVGTQIEHIQRSTKQLVSLVDRLVADAMVDALDISIRRDPVDVGDLVREVADSGRLLAEKKQQRVAISVMENLVTQGDCERLREAIDNVVSNAVKYSPIGGEIAIHAMADRENALIQVQDSGPGLSPEDLSRLFGRFQRLSARPTGGESSTGLGLFIAKRIIDLHGGRIDAENVRSGSGARFTICLPLNNPAPS